MTTNASLRCNQCGSIYIADPTEPVMSREDAEKLSPLLDNNQALTEYDRYLIQEWERTFEDPLQQLDDAILRLREQLALLEERRRTTKATQLRFKQALTLIRVLPDEILLEIFHHVLVVDDRDCTDIFDLSEPPWTLSRVSRHWRAISLSCSALWAFHMRFDLQRAVGCPNPLAIANHVLELAGWQRSISFSIMFEGTEGLEDGLCVDVLCLVMDRCLQWQCAYFFDFPLDLVPHLSSIRGKLPKLRDLFIAFQEYPLDPIDAFEICPALTKVNLSGGEGENMFRAVLLPDSQLQCLECTCPLAGVIDMIETCPSLDTIEAFPDLRPLDSDPPLRVAHKNISKLVTSDEGLLSCLTLPNLQVLNVDGSELDLLYCLPGVRELLQISKCQLASLTLCDCTLLPSAEFVDILGLCSSLRELHIEFTEGFHDPAQGNALAALMRAMSRPGETGGYSCLPVLKSFSYHDYTSPRTLDWVDQEVFIDVVVGRGVALAIDIGFTSQFPESVIKLEDVFRWELQQKKAMKGIDISIREIMREKDGKRPYFRYV